MQATGGELLQDGLVRARNAARGVYVFHAHQPLTLVGSGIEPTGQCRYQGARMQRASGGGGEAPDVASPHDPSGYRECEFQS